MKYARIVNNTAIDVRTESPEGCYTPNIVAEFVEVPDEVQDGWIHDNLSGTWSAPPPPPVPTPQPVVFPTLSPMQFYMAFSPTERIAIKKSTDEIVMEFWSTYELAVQTKTNIDPNLPSVVSGLEYLANPTPAGAGILSSTRIPQILLGIPQ